MPAAEARQQQMITTHTVSLVAATVFDAWAVDQRPGCGAVVAQSRADAHPKMRGRAKASTGRRQPRGPLAVTSEVVSDG